ncbi:Nucleoside-diphosphate-sugar epimerase [Arachidicoccus rhizosphaerae]|uniref:Nucleoside-diphosphate-sugar epimerase n=1 Tax=Arachidicoccus rhizosphaerae TaxID=551991 RepID=A0A1H4BSQ7_9BACT|nr:NAD-dependent epimerase/dehydratase family protein [Arachidicoccus rhizosphaerae]SEA51185.1 Nucleoside-diphosphate-sugar epimerase [Arachidicoccus rhizosphaerae]
MIEKKLLITGANGFVGSHLAKLALDNGYKVFAAVRKTSDLSALEGLAVTLVYPDYRNINSITALLDQAGITHIAHVAGKTKGRNLDEYMEANATVTVSLARAALECRQVVEKFVFVSSMAVMGPAPFGKELTELDAPQPVTLYGKSKWQAEQYLADYGSLPLITLRPTAVYGPRDKDMRLVIDMVAKGWELYLGKGPQQLSFIYVKDLCQAILLALASKSNQQTYILSDGVNYSRYDFANQAKKVLKRKTLKLHLPVGVISFALGVLEKVWPSRTSILNRDKLKELTGNWACSIQKARKELGYSPVYPLSTGMEKTIAWNQAPEKAH